MEAIFGLSAIGSLAQPIFDVINKHLVDKPAEENRKRNLLKQEKGNNLLKASENYSEKTPVSATAAINENTRHV